MSAASPTPDSQSPEPYSNNRFITFDSIFNYRDLGGLAGPDGTKVRTGQIYRSDQFGNASQADVNYLVQELGLRAVVDLRREAEIAATAAFPAHRGVTVHHHELKHLRWETFERSTRTDQVSFLTQRYTAMLETGAEAIRDTLNLMLDETPLVFHCMAGKDRTGIIAAIVLGLLGVSFEDIVDDYSLTVQGLNRYYAWQERTGQNVSWGIGAEHAAMAAMLENVESYFGSVDSYAQIIGFTEADKLRQKMLS